MGLMEEPNKEVYQGNGVATDFDFDFKLFEENDLKVFKLDTVLNTITELLQSVPDYSVSLGQDNVGGTVSLTTAPLSTEQILIIRETDLKNTLEIEQFNFSPKRIEDQFDFVTGVLQDTAEKVERSLKVSAFKQGFNPVLPEDIGPGVSLFVNETGDGLEIGPTKTEVESKVTAAEVPALAPVQSVAGKTGVVTLEKADVGLSLVDNTSDAQKIASGPIRDFIDNLELLDLSDVDASGFTEVAVVTYNPATQQFEAGATGTGGGAVSSVNGQIGVVVLDKTDIGLENVDNTSDANKPISTAQQTALDGKEDSLGNPASDGQVLASTTAGVRSFVNLPTVLPASYRFQGLDNNIDRQAGDSFVEGGGATVNNINLGNPADVPGLTFYAKGNDFSSTVVNTNSGTIDFNNFAPISVPSIGLVYAFYSDGSTWRQIGLPCRYAYEEERLANTISNSDNTDIVEFRKTATDLAPYVGWKCRVTLSGVLQADGGFARLIATYNSVRVATQEIREGNDVAGFNLAHQSSIGILFDIVSGQQLTIATSAFSTNDQLFGLNTNPDNPSRVYYEYFPPGYFINQ